MKRGVDLSAYQDSINWDEVANSPDVHFVFAKATEGLNYVNTEFASQHDGCVRHGIPFGAYHFARFGEDPVAQATHFLATIAGREGTLLPMIDVEGGGQDGVTELDHLVAWLAAFNHVVEQTLHGKRILIYSDYGDWSGMMQGTDAFAGHPYWVAEYSHQAAPTLPNGFSTWALWQYTSGGLIHGINGFVDMNVLNGDSLADISR